MAVLKPHHLDLLRYIVSRLGPVPLSELDRRQLRPLKANGLLAEYGQSVLPTSEGRRLAADEEAVREAVPPSTAAAGPMLSEAQESMLRLLLRSPEPMLADHLDGRVLRALDSRGLIRIERGWVTPSPAGAGYFDQHVRKTRALRTRRASSATGGGARAQALLRAVEQLESALPRGAEVTVAGMPAYADDVFAGLRRLAAQMESRPAA